MASGAFSRAGGAWRNTRPEARERTPIAATVQKPAPKPQPAMIIPAQTVPAIWPKLVIAFSVPIKLLRSPGSWLTSVQLAGQYTARATIIMICAANRPAKLDDAANMNPDAAVGTNATRALFMPPGRS